MALIDGSSYSSKVVAAAIKWMHPDDLLLIIHCVEELSSPYAHSGESV